MSGRGQRRALDSSSRALDSSKSQATKTALADLLTSSTGDAERSSIHRYENGNAARYGRRRQQTFPLIGSLTLSRLVWHQRDALCVR